MDIRKRFTAAMALAAPAVLLVALASCGGGRDSAPVASDGQMTAAAIRVTAAAGAGAASASNATALSSSSSSSREIGFDELRAILEDETRRVEIELLPLGLIADELEVEDPDEIFDDEEIESRIKDLQFNSLTRTGTITLELGNLKVDFSEADTEFEVDRDSGDQPLTFDQFVDRVRDALARGQRPPVEAERNPKDPAQAPDDPTFFAREIELEDEVDEDEIEINVDARHVDADTLEDCDLTQGIQVLDLCIAIVPGTEIEVED